MAAMLAAVLVEWWEPQQQLLRPCSLQLQVASGVRLTQAVVLWVLCCAFVACGSGNGAAPVFVCHSHWQAGMCSALPPCQKRHPGG